MPTDPEFWTAFVETFIDRSRRERWRTKIHTRQGRVKLRTTLDHGQDFDPRIATSLGDEDDPEEIIRLLKRRKAGELCHVLSSDRELDGATLPIEEAIRRVVGGGFGTYLVFDPCRLAFFESEESGTRFILERAAESRRHA